jgi:hypothetical protein
LIADAMSRSRGGVSRCVRRGLSCVVAGTWAVSAALHAAGLNGFDLTGALVPQDAIHQGGPPKDGIPAIDRPDFVTAREAAFLRPDDRILGVARNGLAKAYPIAILNWHEVVNDRFESEPVVVTFCPLCGTGTAHSARADGMDLQFGVSGLLYNSDVLLYDRQTQSLWSQLMSTAIAGPHKGKRLASLPISHTSWAKWRKDHPGTLVLSPATGFPRDYGRDPYAGYARSEEIMFPVRFASQRFHPKEQVVGVELGGRHQAYPFSELRRRGGAVADTVGGSPIRVEFDAEHRSARVLDARGQELPSVIAYWFAWYAFHPRTEVFTAQ